MRARRSATFAGIFSMVLTSAVVAGFTGAGAHGVGTDQSYWVPVDKQVVVRGHGYGHGHGMSQYGAQGAAQQGRTYQQIVGFYYPGTTLAKMRGRVRVLITSDTSSDVAVSPARGLSMRDLGDGSNHLLPGIEGVRRWRLNVSAGKTVVAYLTNRWHRYRPGGKAALAGDGEFFAATPIQLLTPSGATKYRGRLRSASPYPGSSARDTVNVLSMDDYVKGVVADEMPASWHPEAVKSQAVAARTYATWSRSQNMRRYYQICDTTACQVYGGVDAEDHRSNAAVDATRRQILTYGGKPAFTQFSSSSGGWTSAGSVPYLTAKRDPYDGWRGNPVHSWSVTVDARRLERSYPQLGTLRRIRVVDRDGNGDWQGRVHKLVLDGSRADVTMSGDSFRWAFGLRSNWFTIDPTPIMARWARIGGAKSPVGVARNREYRVQQGTAQTFRRGKIYYSARTGAREIYGPILGRYRDMGGAASELRFPISRVQSFTPGARVRFQGGDIYRHRSTGAVAVLGRIAERYRSFGAVRSDLGWPTRGNYAVRGGQRADFQHGTITWHRQTNRTVVRVSR